MPLDPFGLISKPKVCFAGRTLPMAKPKVCFAKIF